MPTIKSPNKSKVYLSNVKLHKTHNMNDKVKLHKTHALNIIIKWNYLQNDKINKLKNHTFIFKAQNSADAAILSTQHFCRHKNSTDAGILLKCWLGTCQKILMRRFPRLPHNAPFLPTTSKCYIYACFIKTL